MCQSYQIISHTISSAGKVRLCLGRQWVGVSDYRHQIYNTPSSRPPRCPSLSPRCRHRYLGQRGFPYTPPLLLHWFSSDGLNP